MFYCYNSKYFKFWCKCLWIFCMKGSLHFFFPNFMESCAGGGGSGRVDGGGGRKVGGGGGDSSGSGGGYRWLWLLFIVVNILFYCNRYIILLWCLYYFIVLKAKIDPLLQYVLKWTPVWLELPSPIHSSKPNTRSIRKLSTSRIVTPCNSWPMTYIYIYIRFVI